MWDVAVKEAVFPFNKIPDADTQLGPEMRSTGEVMGLGRQLRPGVRQGAGIGRRSHFRWRAKVVVTVHDRDKPAATPIVRRFHELGFEIVATDGTARYLRGRGVPCQSVLKVHEGRPNILDLLLSGDIQLLLNTPLGKHAQQDDYMIRRAAITRGVPYTTTLSAASAATDAIMALRSRKLSVRSLQERSRDPESRSPHAALHMKEPVCPRASGSAMG